MSRRPKASANAGERHWDSTPCMRTIRRSHRVGWLCSRRRKYSHDTWSGPQPKGKSDCHSGSEGLTNCEIGRIIGTSEQVVKNHLRRSFDKLANLESGVGWNRQCALASHRG